MWEEWEEGEFEGLAAGSQAEMMLKGLVMEADRGDVEAAEMYCTLEDFMTPAGNKKARGATSGVKRRGVGGGADFQEMVKKAMKGLAREELEAL